MNHELRAMNWFRKGSRIQKSKGSRIRGVKGSSDFAMNHELRTMSRFSKDSRSLTLRSLLSALRSPKGFTAIEVTMIVVALAILAISIVVKNPFGTQDYATIAADQLIADIQYVQMRAMGMGSQQNITFTSGSGAYTVAGEQKNLPGSIKVISATLTVTFNSLGEPTFGTTDQTITISGSCTIRIYAITGKVE